MVVVGYLRVFWWWFIRIKPIHNRSKFILIKINTISIHLLWWNRSVINNRRTHKSNECPCNPIETRPYLWSIHTTLLQITLSMISNLLSMDLKILVTSIMLYRIQFLHVMELSNSFLLFTLSPIEAVRKKIIFLLFLFISLFRSPSLLLVNHFAAEVDFHSKIHSAKLFYTDVVIPTHIHSRSICFFDLRTFACVCVCFQKIRLVIRTFPAPWDYSALNQNTNNEWTVSFQATNTMCFLVDIDCVLIWITHKKNVQRKKSCLFYMCVFLCIFVIEWVFDVTKDVFFPHWDGFGWLHLGKLSTNHQIPEENVVTCIWLASIHRLITNGMKAAHIKAIFKSK